MKQKRIILVIILVLALLSCCTLASNSPTVGSVSPTTHYTIGPTLPEKNDISTEPTIATGSSSFEVHYIDVGQADAALILCDGEALLIDGGNVEDSSLIYAYLQSHGVDYLDYIVCTHAHEDHVGGLSGALNYATVGTAYCPVTEYDSNAFRNFVKYLEAQNTEITVPSPGDCFPIGSATATIYGPIFETDEPNNTSIILRIVYGKTSFLFTGDAETVEEDAVLDAGYDVGCTVLKVGHHGSNTSTGYRWLREASPKYAVISVGADNSYGHPTEETLSKLRDAEVTVFRTDMQGDIVCTSDGENVTFTVERNANADTLSGAGLGGNLTPNEIPATTDTSTEANSTTEITYVCNTSSMKFHDPECSSVDDMSEKNKLEVTVTREDLIAQGYEPCGRCKP